MENKDIRLYARGADVPLWKIADTIGVSEATLTRMLRKPLDDGERKRIISAIDTIRKGDL